MLTEEGRLEILKRAIRHDSSIFSSNEQLLKLAYNDTKCILKADEIIKKELIDMIDKCLRNAQLSRSKQEILRALRAFVVLPGDDTWTRVCVSMYSNPGYENGFFSKTRDLIVKINVLYSAYITRKEIPPKKIHMCSITSSNALYETFFNNPYKLHTENNIKDLYSFINGAKTWNDVSHSAKNYTRDSNINELIKDRFVRKCMPEIDKLCVEICLYLKKHTSSGSKHNVMLALYNFIDNPGFSLNDLQRVIVENPNYDRSYTQHSRVLKFKMDVMKHADEIIAKKIGPHAESVNNQVSAVNCLEKLRRLSMRYGQRDMIDKFSVCNAFIKVLENDSSNEAWADMFEKQMNYPMWNKALRTSELTTCYLEIKRLYVQHSDYFNFCEKLLEIVYGYQQHKYVDKFILQHAKIIASVMQRYFFNAPVISEKLVEHALTALENSPLMTKARLATLTDIFFANNSDDKNSRSSIRNSITTFSDGSSVRDTIALRNSKEKNENHLNLLGRVGGFRFG